MPYTVIGVKKEKKKGKVSKSLDDLFCNIKRRKVFIFLKVLIVIKNAKQSTKHEFGKLLTQSHVCIHGL